MIMTIQYLLILKSEPCVFIPSPLWLVTHIFTESFLAEVLF